MPFLTTPHIQDTLRTHRVPFLFFHVENAIYQVQENLVYQVAPGMTVTVPAGFFTDYASIPSYFWRILPPTGWYRLAAVVHDYLYTEDLSRCSKCVADCVFFQAMGELPYVTMTSRKQAERHAIYQAVHLLGSYPSRNILL